MNQRICVLLLVFSPAAMVVGQEAANEINPLRPAEAAFADPTPPAEQTTESSGDPPPPPPAETEFSKEQIDGRLSSVKNSNLSEDEKATVLEFYQDALLTTAALKAKRGEIKKWQIDHAEVTDPKDPDGPKQFTKSWYDKRLALPVEHPLVSDSLEPFNVYFATEEQLEKRASALDEKSKYWSKQVEELETSEATQSNFKKNLEKTRPEVKQKLDEAEKRLEEIENEGVTSEKVNAERVALVQTVALAEAEQESLEAQSAAYDRRKDLRVLELKLARRKAEAYGQRLQVVREELNSRREQEATRYVKAAQADYERYKELIERNKDSLGELSSKNMSLAADIQNLVEEEQTVTNESDEASESNTKIDATFKLFQGQFGDDSKLSQTSGALLREQRENLPYPSRLQSSIARRTSQRNNISFIRFKASQEQKQLQDRDATAAKLLEKVAAEDKEQAAQAIGVFLDRKEQLLEKYIDALDDLEITLSKSISETTKLKLTTQQFRDFIAERDLWIRSCEPLWASDIQLGKSADLAKWRPFYWTPTRDAIAWSFSPKNWWGVFTDLQRATSRQPLLLVVLSLSVLVLLYVQQRARIHLRELGEQAADKTCTKFLPSLRAVWLTLIVSLPWPLLLWSVGRVLENTSIEFDFTMAFSRSCRLTAWLLLLAEFTRQCCRTGGVAESHLGWQHASLMQIRRYLRWIPPVVLPLVFWQIALDAQTTQPLWTDSLGRLLFLSIMAYSAFVLWRILISHNSSLYQLLTRGTQSWLSNMHTIWRPLLVAIPIVLSVMAILGYYYTAEQLTRRIVATIAMLVVLMVAGGLLRRWVLLNRRMLAREQAQKRRAQMLEAAKEGDNVASVTEIVEETVDLTALSEQTRKLLRAVLIIVGVFSTVFIWQEVFPALRWLNENPLPWSTGDNPTTWGNLLSSLLIGVITYVAVRDIPSLLELVVLQHLPVDSGARYAIATIVRYILLAIGIVVAAAALGITGTSISWLVAAMGVGLGFGLQEIFANFVSGIILLFERPIRVGDIITLGDKTGIVSRIRIRATTITDWDRKEYVVPNKDLVTERLLNWTLSDQTNRVVIPIGVAYGSDTDRACALLREIVEEHPIVMDDPAALITFEGFGDSTLNIILRCYLPNLDNRLSTIHELHTTIHNRFNAEGIEIAFPQQDLHIRSMPPEWQATIGENKAETNGSARESSKAKSS